MFFRLVRWLVGWLVGWFLDINPSGLFNAKSCFYIYDLYVNSLLVTQFLNESLEPICLHTVEKFQVFLSNSNNYIYQAFLSNMKYFHTVLWFQITNNNP